MEKKRLSQLISLLVASTAAQGLLVTPSFATSDEIIIDSAVTDVQVTSAKDLIHITNPGSITGTATTALTLNQGVTVTTLTNDGLINDLIDNSTSSNSNIVQLDGTVGTFDNTGTIASVNRYHYGSIVALGASGTIDTFINSGTIRNAPDNYNIGFNNIGAVSNNGYIRSFTNTVDGTILGYRGISNQGTIDNLTNAGVISSDSSNMGLPMGQNGAIYNSGTIGTLHNTGTITSGSVNQFDNSGIYNQGTITTLINDHEISGSYFGIQNDGAIGSIINNGEINGDIFGIYISSYNNLIPATQIINNGTLRGGIYALYIDGNGNTDVTLTNSHIVSGDIISSSAAPLKINGGTTSTGILTGSNGIGSITANGSNVIFGTGSLLLDDHVTTSGAGGTVLNDAASLQVNNNINISGNYHQNAAATLISGVSDLATQGGAILADTGYGRLNVSGNATVDAGSSVNLLRTGTTYKFAEGQRYVVITAAGAGTDYNADKLNYKAVGYRGAVNGAVYEDGSNKALVLSVGPETVVTPPVVTPPVVNPPVVTDPTTPITTPTAPTPVQPTPTTKPGLATIPGATAALGGLANYSGISSPQLLELYNASLAIEGTSEANRAGESLSPAQNINTSSAATVATSTAQAVVGAHIDAVRSPNSSGISGVATGDDYSSNWIVWGQPFGGYARQDSTDEASGYTAKFGGLLLGADRSLGEDWRLGAAVNYSNTSVHGKDNLSGNTSTADNYGVIGYAGYTGKPWYLNLSAGVNRQNYSSVRRADFTGFSGAAQGKFNGQSVTLQTEVGYPIVLPAQVVLTPLASLTYGYQHVDGYKETGGNGMALDVDSTHSQSVVSTLGGRIDKTFATGVGNLTPFAQVSWIHQYDNRQVSSSASYAADTIGETSFITKGASPVEDMAGIAIGSTLYDENELSFDARYDLQAGDRYQAHIFSLRLRKMF